MQFALQQKEQEKQQILLQSASQPIATPQSFDNGSTKTSIQPSNLSSLLAEAAEASDLESVQEYKIKCARLHREIELKKEYLAEKEMFWHEEMEKLEDLIAKRDEELKTLRADVASLRVERGQDSVDARSRDLLSARHQQAMEIKLSELEIELKSEQNRNAKMQSDHASDLVTVRHEMAVEKSRTKMFINICLPTLEEYGLQVNNDPAEVASSMVSLINEMKTRTHKVASVINGTPQPAQKSTSVVESIVKTVKDKLDHSENAQDSKSNSDVASSVDVPEIDKLIIHGSKEHGSPVTAQGLLHGASKCKFSWFRGKKQNTQTSNTGDDYVYSPILGISTPTYNTSAMDAGCMIKVEAVPVKEKGTGQGNGIEGPVSVATIGEMETSEDVKNRVDQCMNILKCSDEKLKPTIQFEVVLDGEEKKEECLVIFEGSLGEDGPIYSLKITKKDEDNITLVSEDIRKWIFEAVSTSSKGVILLKKNSSEETTSSDRNILRVDTQNTSDRDVLLLVVQNLTPVDHKDDRSIANEQHISAAIISETNKDVASSSEVTTKSETEMSVRPFIKNLTIVGEARVGEKLMACGDIDGGTGDNDLCRFQWYRSLSPVTDTSTSSADHTQSSSLSQPRVIPGAHAPIYYISPDDVGYVLSVITKIDNEDGTSVAANDTSDNNGQIKSAVADEGKVVTIGPNMKKYVDLQNDGKSLLFKCKAIKLPSSSTATTSSSASTASGSGDASSSTSATDMIDARIVFDEKNVTLFKHEAGALLKLNMHKSSIDNIALLEPMHNDNKLIFRESKLLFELVMEDRVRRDVCVIVYRAAIERIKKTPQKRKSLFRRG